MTAPERRRPSGRALLGLGLAVLVLDQATKLAILYWIMDPPRMVELAPFLNLVLTFNEGISFGLLGGGGTLKAAVLAAGATAVVGGLCFWASRERRFLVRLAIPLIAGGALGNVMDRLRLGAVVDFIDAHAMGYHWYTFNIADSAITIGIAMIVIDTLFGSRDRSEGE